MVRPRFKPVEVVGEANEEGLQTLVSQRAPSSACRKLALHHREHRFDEGAASVNGPGEISPHLRAHPREAPGSLAALCPDDVMGSEDPADMSVVEFAVELRVGKNPPDGRSKRGGVDEWTQVGRVVGRSLLGDLGDDELPSNIHRHYPLQVVAPGETVASVPGHIHEEGADRAGGQPRSIHPDCIGAPPEGGAGRRRTTPASARAPDPAK